jgi:hypothetical protein
MSPFVDILRRVRLLVLLLAALGGPAATASSFIEDHADLKKYLFEEPQSNIYLAFGVSPLTILSNRIMVSLDAFQVHLLTRRWDWEIFGASFGFGISNNSLTNSRQVILRTFPKLRLGSFFSVGPLVGFQYVGFPNVGTKIIKGTLASPNFEPFSSTGYLYGGGASETFKLGEGYILKLNQVIYQETYSTTTTSDGWSYLYQDSGLENDSTPIKSGTVFALEFELLF